MFPKRKRRSAPGNPLEAGRAVRGQPFEACDQGCLLLVTGPQCSGEGLPGAWGPRPGGGLPQTLPHPRAARPGRSSPWAARGPGSGAEGLSSVCGGRRLRRLHHAWPADELPPVRGGEAQGAAAAPPRHLLRQVGPPRALRSLESSLDEAVRPGSPTFPTSQVSARGRRPDPGLGRACGPPSPQSEEAHRLHATGGAPSPKGRWGVQAGTPFPCVPSSRRPHAAPLPVLPPGTR